MSPPVLVALLHEGGWDEVVMVGVGLLLAYAVIMLTGRKGRDDEALDVLDEHAAESDEPLDRRPK